MRKLAIAKMRERTGPWPGQKFETSINSNNSELDARTVATDFAEWINSDRGRFDAHIEIKQIFLELTRLTVDHVGQQQKLLARGFQKRHRAGQPYVDKINLILNRLQERYPAGLRLRDFAGQDGRIVFLDRPLVGDDVQHQSEFSMSHAANYALRQFRLLADHNMFAAFRRCAVKTCDRHFFPLRSERRYCSDACQGKHYMQDPLRTKKNAAYQKVNYHTKKVQELGKLADSSPIRREKYEDAKKTLELAKAKLAALQRRRR